MLFRPFEARRGVWNLGDFSLAAGFVTVTGGPVRDHEELSEWYALTAQEDSVLALWRDSREGGLRW